MELPSKVLAEYGALEEGSASEPVERESMELSKEIRTTPAELFEDCEALAEIRRALAVIEREALTTENALMAKEHEELLVVEKKMLTLLENGSQDGAPAELQGGAALKQTEDCEALAEIRKALAVMERDYQALTTENALMAKEHEQLLVVEKKMLTLLENGSQDGAPAELQGGAALEQTHWEKTLCKRCHHKTGSLTSSFSTESLSAGSVSCWSSISTECASATSTGSASCWSSASMESTSAGATTIPCDEEDAEIEIHDVRYYTQHFCPALQESLAHKCRSLFVSQRGNQRTQPAPPKSPTTRVQIRKPQQRRWR